MARYKIKQTDIGFNFFVCCAIQSVFRIHYMQKNDSLISLRHNGKCDFAPFSLTIQLSFLYYFVDLAWTDCKKKRTKNAIMQNNISLQEKNKYLHRY